MTERPTISTAAPAKLNLALAVGPADSRGLHAICSWMVTVDFEDELAVSRLEDDRLSRYAILWHETAKRRSEIDWPITSDLAVRAHLALERWAGRRLPVQLKLEKRIPVGAGLGGGSSNAAAMLRAVNELFELGLTDDELATIGAGIGSDVPFLVHGGSAIVEGTGERLTRHDHVPELHAVVALPECRCSTRDVYATFDDVPTGDFRPDAVTSLAGDARRAPRPDGLFNDLTRPAIRIAPALEALLAELSELAERPAALSGSGAAMFVICDDAVHAETLAATAERRLELPSVAVRAAAHRSPALLSPEGPAR